MGRESESHELIVAVRLALSRSDSTCHPGLGFAMSRHPTLFEVEDAKHDAVSGTFARSMGEAVHRWFRYSAGFSSVWAEEVIGKRVAEAGRPVNVLDPFAGSGTTVLAAQTAGADSVGVESHPFVIRVARAKLQWGVEVADFEARAAEVVKNARPMKATNESPALLQKCFSEETLAGLFGLKRSIDEANDGSGVDSLAWLAFVSIIRRCSHVGTAQWQYVLPNKSKARVLSWQDAWRLQVMTMAADMREMQRLVEPRSAVVHQGDARVCEEVPDGWADLVVTSPPYANNYDYADATRLEMTLLGEVSGWGQLKEVRQHLVRSCSQHMTGYDLEAGLSDPILEPIRAELVPVVRELSAVKETHGGKKAYDAMVTAYFIDLAHVWQALARTTNSSAQVCFVVGDSAPYGVHAPVERWLGELALASGFRSWSFDKTRDRNTKWKNRKHQVPLHEGRLWVVA